MPANNRPMSLSPRITSCSTSCQGTLDPKAKNGSKGDRTPPWNRKSLKITEYKETVSGLEKSELRMTGN